MHEDDRLLTITEAAKFLRTRDRRSRALNRRSDPSIVAGTPTEFGNGVARRRFQGTAWLPGARFAELPGPPHRLLGIDIAQMKMANRRQMCLYRAPSYERIRSHVIAHDHEARAIELILQRAELFASGAAGS